MPPGLWQQRGETRLIAENLGMVEKESNNRGNNVQKIFK
jgi:hypothetical protein